MINRMKTRNASIVFLAIALLFSWAVVSHAQDTNNIASVTEPGKVLHVNPQEAASIIKDNPEIVILDVRTPVEYRYGHIADAININYYSFSFKKKLAQLDKDKTYLVHCQTGVRSGKTMPMMLRAGFTNLIHMDGGYKSWKNSGLPVQ